ncbi:hypothetical protein ABZT34_11535 [Streptomyces sp. NPDC005329]|uniref:hypothetical protein n=1 Tax=Streptomyces sp. NPDC005329 TaxID=3157034 RepID=UPI0033AC5364
MGQVYLGESPGGEPAAVKVIKRSVVDSTSRLRFAQEIEANGEKPLTSAVDVYPLGTVLLFAATGHLPSWSLC